ncbi:hypothetical protein SERLA73DRAFT_190654, partial [Serpula lacrymans var. lacrymans S7.3]
NKKSNPDFFSTLKFTTLLLVIQCGHNTSHFYHCQLLSSSLPTFEVIVIPFD